MVRIFALAGLWLLSLSTQAAVSARVDKNPVLIGEAFTLTISSEDGTEEPDLSVLEPDFEILGRSTSSQFQIINGRTQRSHDWQIRLRPLRPGQLRIPPIALGSERTAAIGLQVVEPQRAPGELPEAFIEFAADADVVRVREQLILRSRLFVRGDLVSGSLSDPASSQAVIEQLGEQTESQALRGRHRYRVIERRYALFPEQSGPLSVRAPVFNGEIATGAQRRTLFGFGGGTRAVQASGDPIALEVRPQPADYRGSVWLPAADVHLSDALSPDGGPYRAGDPLTRTITLQVDGQLHTQLPDLDIPAPPGTQSYTEAPQDETRAGADGLRAIRRYSVAVIPAQAGELVLPELRLDWWDTAQERLRTAVLPARTLSIVPAPGRAAAPTPASAPASISSEASTPGPVATTAPLWPWQVATAAALAGWIGTLLSWWWFGRARRAPAQANDEIGRRRLITTLRREPAITCHQALLRWARQQRPELPGLLALARYGDDPQLPAALAALDQAAFGGGAEFDRETLIRFVREFRYAAAADEPPPLAPLYPGAH